MKVIERNVITGEVTERFYTTKELDAVEIAVVIANDKKQKEDKKKDIDVKRRAAIEHILMSSNSTEAKAYQDAIK